MLPLTKGIKRLFTFLTHLPAMLRIYDCIVGDHDLRLVALAVVVCVFACFTAFSLAMRAKVAARHRHWWLVGVGVATGSGIWATHFIAMLAFRPDLPVAYEPIQTLQIGRAHV